MGKILVFFIMLKLIFFTVRMSLRGRFKSRNIVQPSIVMILRSRFDPWWCWLCPIWPAWLLTLLTRPLESHTGFLRRRCWTSSPGSSSSCPPPCRTTTSCAATLWRTTATWFRITTPARPRTRWPSPRRTARPGGCRPTGSGSVSARGESFRPVSDTSGQVDTDTVLNVKQQ